MYHFTELQDIRGFIGYKAHCNQKGQLVLVCSATAMPQLMAFTPSKLCVMLSISLLSCMSSANLGKPIMLLVACLVIT